MKIQHRFRGNGVGEQRGRGSRCPLFKTGAILWKCLNTFVPLWSFLACLWVEGKEQSFSFPTPTPMLFIRGQPVLLSFGEHTGSHSRPFWHGFTSVIMIRILRLLPKTMNGPPCWSPKLRQAELFSDIKPWTLSFFSINLHSSRPRDWKRSIKPREKRTLPSETNFYMLIWNQW